MTEMFGEAWSPMSVRDLAPDDNDDCSKGWLIITGREKEREIGRKKEKERERESEKERGRKRERDR